MRTSTDGSPVKGRKRLDLHTLKQNLAHSIGCMLCGGTCSREEIHLHHINLDPRDNRLKNLSFVCRTCHKEIHRQDGSSIRPRYKAEYTRKPFSDKDPYRKWRGMSLQERFDVTYADKGGFDRFVEMYNNRDISTAVIGIHFGVTRERVRQIAVKAGMPTRGRGFMGHNGWIRGNHDFRHLPLSKYLKQNNMRVVDFALKLGTSKGYAYQILTMSCPISATRAKRIADITGLSVDEILMPQLAPQPQAVSF